MAILLVLGHPALAGWPPQHEGHQTAPSRPQPKAEPQPHPEKILGWEPLRCWRQSTAGAVSVGEAFSVVLTCAVYEGDNAQVIPDESRLGVASIQMAPFEIIGGSHPPDVHRAARRFFQYDYQLRIISPDAVGQDVNIPPVSISYRIHSKVGAAATLEGRDLSYLMPMMPIKVLSLVPADASDIRDASEANLGAVDALRVRSNVFTALTYAFGALAIVMVVLALVPLARGRKPNGATAPDRVPDRAVLAGAIAGLENAAIQARQGDGWNDDQVAHALAMVRLIAATAIDHPVSQKPPAKAGASTEGRIAVATGLIRQVKTGASSAVTADDVARARRGEAARFSTTRHQQLEGLESALTTLTAALYRREPERDPTAIEAATKHAQGVAKEIAAERSWLKELWARR
jgi:hypothetical protein